MYEFTFGGAWFRWNAFDRKSRLLAAASLALGAIAGALFGMALKPVNHRYGFDVTAHAPILAVAGIAASLLAAWLWYSFSLRRDEMFNRVQNWALGMAGAWTCVIATLWHILERVALASPLTVPAVALLFAVSTGLFWFVAVRRWAL
ncbi:MAG TPA: hypothetical protein VGW34_06820 [Allosphingosinicella sp.]|nr:hypothetical protein [Allosphingosinicella sp.]